MRLKYDGFEFEDITAEEAKALILSLKGEDAPPAPLPDPLNSGRALADPAHVALTAAQVAAPNTAWHGSKKARPWFPMPPKDSLYYTVERKRHHALMAQIYEYVAAFPDGISARQVAEVFRDTLKNTQSRLGSLRDDNLLWRPLDTRFGATYAALYPHSATPEQITMSLERAGA